MTTFLSDTEQPQESKAPPKSARRRAREFVLQGLYQWRVGGADEAARDVLHQADDALEADDLVPLGIEMADFLGVERRVHHAFLDEEQPVLDRVDHREIAVDDEIEDRIEDIVGAVRKLGGQRFEPRADFGVRPRRPVTDADEEMRTEEKSGLARMDRVGIEVRGAGDDEELVAIGLDLGQLVRLQRILDRKRVKAKPFRDALQLSRRGLIKAEPEEIAVSAIQGKLFVGSDIADKLSVMIDAGGHDWHAVITPSICGAYIVRARTKGNAFNRRDWRCW